MSIRRRSTAYRFFLFVVGLAWLAVFAKSAQPKTVTLQPTWKMAKYAGLETIEQQVLALTNAERAKHGLPPLEMNDCLRLAARQHSWEMGDKGYFDHASPVEAWKMPWQRTYMAGYWGRCVGENIVMVDNHEPDQVAERFMKLWMDSPGHRANILSTEWTLIGVGVTEAEGRYYGTQVFARPFVTLESASVTAVNGDLVKLELSGKLRAGVVNVWVNGGHYAAVMPKRGTWETTLSYPRGTGSYDIIVSIGKQASWTATLATDAGEPSRMVTNARTIRAGVVSKAVTRVRPFTGLRLSAIAQAPPGTPAYVLLENRITQSTFPEQDGRLAFDLILPNALTPYTVSIGSGAVCEDLLFIDTMKPIDEVFGGRPK